ncbi:unnamed protein product, partial [Lampetra planeri]
VFGRVAAFVRLWSAVLIIGPSTQAVVALTLANHLLQPLYKPCLAPPPHVAQLLAAACICLATFVNCGYVRWGTRVQDVMVYAKLAALAVIIGAGLLHLMQGHTENFDGALRGLRCGRWLHVPGSVLGSLLVRWVGQSQLRDGGDQEPGEEPAPGHHDLHAAGDSSLPPHQHRLLRRAGQRFHSTEQRTRCDVWRPGPGRDELDNSNRSGTQLFRRPQQLHHRGLK